MFQYAAGFRLSRAHGVPLKLDISGFQDTPSREFSLQNFNISGTVASRSELSWYVNWPSRNRLVRQIQRRLGFSPCTMVHERHFHFDDELLHLSGNVYLSGYWQSEKYFADIAEGVRAQFTIKSQPSDRDRALLARIASENAVSLHVRRGDYVSDPAVGNAHGLCPIEYYIAATEFVASRVKSPSFFVFSDDPDWSQKNLRLRWPTTFAPSHGAASAHADLRLMSSCKHHIIANSSFSWWGAWLNRNPGKTVIAPVRWFNQFEADTRDLLPESWIKL